MTEQTQTVVAWWRSRGEPMALTLLVLAGSAALLVWALGLLSQAAVVRLLLVLCWCMVALLLLRLPRYLQSERARLGVLLGGGATVLACTALLGNTPLRIATTSAQEATNQDALTFVAPPRISRDAFIGLLEQGHGGNGPSPAAPVGGELYDIIVSYGIDPAVALAFFARESQFCTTGMCIGDDMKTWGHLRNAYNPARSAGYEYNDTGQFVRYASWQDSVRDWCELMLHGYVARGLATVDAAVPVYAPLGDGDNNPPQYIDSIYAMVRAWQGLPFVTRREPHVYVSNLQEALLNETFMASDLEFHPNWGFHRYMLEAIGAGQPLGAPLSPSIVVTVKGQRYAVQTFAMDTIYTPLASPEEETNWNDVRRLSDLLRNAQP